ncbi:hypothetical protein Pan153_20830 [Gimesia panareensis]|uniref:DUF4064 domain-containing protein n=1 Tax=Gimesia panareensis TaxID=2527978 RepID=A0A518FM46_9PLAN|nr:hypothetical protein [Gimesia panareensis]QDV17431.1 hypothetical protein Pan153_20830 [Gimesia panareensis]
MLANKSSQLNLVGTLFLILGILSIFNLVFLSRIGERMNENSLANADIRTPDGKPYDGFKQQLAMQQTFLLGMLIISISFTVISLLTGTFMLKRFGHRFCLVGAIVTMIVFPLGTIFGGWALFLLCNREIKQLFQERTELRDADFLD